jgi:hypothetical protein
MIVGNNIKTGQPIKMSVATMQKLIVDNSLIEIVVKPLPVMLENAMNKQSTNASFSIVKITIPAKNDPTK